MLRYQTGPGDPGNGARRAAFALALPLAALLLALAALLALSTDRADAADCQFVLGFGALAEMAPEAVGECIEDEMHNPDQGVTRQHTTTGVLVWRKADNQTFFTNGLQSWVNGPAGLQQRLNSDRFDWESDVDRVIRVGAAISETGRFATEGGDVSSGYRLWANWVNGEYGGIAVGDDRYRVELVLYDDESDVANTRALVEQLISQDQVDFLLGPYSSGLNLGAMEVAESHGTIMVQGAGSATGLYEPGFENHFGVLTPAEDYTKTTLQQLSDSGANTIAIAHADTAFATSVAEGAQKWADAYGMTTFAVSEYPSGSEDLSAIIERAKYVRPKVFVGGGHFNDALLLIRAIKEQDFNPRATVITVGPSNPKLVEMLGADADYVIGPTQWEASMAYSGPHFGSASDYAERYRALWGGMPTYQAASGTAAALALQLAIENAGSLDAAAVRSALRDLSADTFYGPIDFDEQGRNTAKPMGAIQIQDGQILVVAPADAAVAELIYPAPAWSER